MSATLDLLTLGFTAGLALAIPVGPMALLLVDTTLRQGLRIGAAGALAMASVDASYAIVVFLAGSFVTSILGGFGLWLSLGGALILLALGLQTIYRALKPKIKAEAQAGSEQATTSSWKIFVKFAGATVVNPPTALYFLAITPSLAGLAESDPLGATFSFAVGVFFGSVIWQEGLALTGAAIRGITTPRVRTWLSLTGGAMIVTLALVLAAKALGAN
jgi:threonine/homoserine/homoserine lactone efflux protein